MKTAHAATARVAGANLGLFAVGKHLVFVEGQESSTDRAVYHRVAQASFSDAYLLPLGSVTNLMALRTVVAELDNAVFGVRLYMIRDRDGLSDATVADLESNSRFRCLPRRHVENYLLDEDVLAEVAAQFYLEQDLRSPTAIRAALERVAEQVIPIALLASVREWIRMDGPLGQPSVRNAHELRLEEFVASLKSAINAGRNKLNTTFNDEEVTRFVVAEDAKLRQSLADGSWRFVFPGKLLFGRFCGEFWRHDTTRVREAYADIALLKKPIVFEEISTIFRSFAKLG